jgi:hypothetical protein
LNEPHIPQQADTEAYRLYRLQSRLYHRMHASLEDWRRTQVWTYFFAYA